MAQTVRTWNAEIHGVSMSLDKYLLHLAETPGVSIVQVIPMSYCEEQISGQYGGLKNKFSAQHVVESAAVVIDIREPFSGHADTKAMTESAIAFLQSQGLLPS